MSCFPEEPLAQCLASYQAVGLQGCGVLDDFLVLHLHVCESSFEVIFALACPRILHRSTLLNSVRLDHRPIAVFVIFDFYPYDFTLSA